MNMYQQVEEYREPLEIIKSWQTSIGTDNILCNSEMLDSELGFLCGLIKKNKPKKMVEVGVSAGGTSAVILTCLEQLSLDTQVFSVDLAEKCHLNSSKQSGYLIEQAKQCGVDTRRSHLLLGETVAAHLEDIGQGIDFLILDTIHSLPGEVMDFLVCFPYLAPGAVVVLHDVAQQFSIDERFDYATSVLFHSVTADKFLNNAEVYPNIAAFQINEDTGKYIMDVVAGLLMPWMYMPETRDLEKYEAILSKHYPPEVLKLYRQARDGMREKVVPFARKTFCVDLKDIHINAGSIGIENVLIYGTKKLGRECLAGLCEQGISPKGFLVSDGRKKQETIDGIPVFEFSQNPYPVEGTLIILANTHKETEENLRASKYSWIKGEKRFIKDFGSAFLFVSM